MRQNAGSCGSRVLCLEIAMHAKVSWWVRGRRVRLLLGPAMCGCQQHPVSSDHFLAPLVTAVRPVLRQR